MESCVESKLQNLGYYVNTVPYGYINACNAWYKNELIEKFHRRTSIQGEEYVIERMNFAKRGCADDANLCEIIQINVGNANQTDEILSLIHI